MICSKEPNRASNKSGAQSVLNVTHVLLL